MNLLFLYFYKEIMEALNNDPLKLSDMVMCGDHPLLTTTDLSPKDAKMEEKEKEKEKQKDKHSLSYAKITPSVSRTEALDSRAHILSEHTLRTHDIQRRIRSERERSEGGTPTSNPVKPILQAFPWSALGTFRWPPYLLAVWVLVLVLTHVLHCLVSLLERALPTIRGCIQYFKTWTEETWKNETEINHQKLYPIGLAFLTALLYVVYFGLYALYAVVMWSIEPLSADPEDSRNGSDLEAKVTNYIDDVNSKTNTTVKQ